MDLLAHLEAFVAIAEEGSFSAAADKLYVAQPVLSRRIKTLEQHLGGTLFDRTRRRVGTTDFGVLLLPHARDVLSRVDHLRQVASTALSTATHALGVPPDTDPAGLARVIRAGADRGVTIGVRELSAEDREHGLTDGSLAFAVLRVAPETASLRVALGLATASHSGPSGRAVHLEDLRPRRGAEGPPAPILTTGEDEVPFAAERLAKAAARAGISTGRIRSATSAAAVADALAGAAMLLCTAPFARRHALSWSPLADTALHRGYEFALSSRLTERRGAPEVTWLGPLVASALGATSGPGGVEPDTAPNDHSHHARIRLAARG
ncbi:LysR family transcriptional regulator [Saccharomonospora cyanea]|uniref:Transcriptional regulator n=1 Tax=Saccharomonospora cyanea NA-134 TaxID=882082 RepID=H5XLN4_9PSEU|nr:LysR family transcriptional regulator [Saccharomonospora cyanea]EHR60932.1 transcriptional regulator [Saccharomonospora cyanea NA-134]